MENTERSLTGHLLKTIIALSILGLVTLSMGSAEVLDKVVAFVDDEAITLSELEAAHASALKRKPGSTRQEVLLRMINRYILLREARRLRLEAPDEDTLIEEYVSLRVTAFLTIDEKDVKEFYGKNRKEFPGKRFPEVKDRIRKYLHQEEVNRMLKRHVEELKSKSEIKILPE
jgi:hypothetical protein